MRSFYFFTFVGIISVLTVLADSKTPEMDIQVTEVTKNIHTFSCFYGTHYVNVTAFSGPDGTLLIDTGHKKTAKTLAGKLKELNLSDVKYIINTHHHGDHTGGNRLFGSKATVFAHEKASSRLYMQVDGTNDTRIVGLPDSIITDSLILHFNSDTLRVIYLPDGHTNGDVIIHIVGANVVCMGDLLFSDALPHIFKRDGGSVDGFINNLETVLNMFPEDVTLIPGHGRIYTMAELRIYKNMLSDLTQLVRAEFESGKNLDEVFAAGVLTNWKDWVSQEFVNDSAYVLIVWDNDRNR